MSTTHFAIAALDHNLFRMFTGIEINVTARVPPDSTCPLLILISYEHGRQSQPEKVYYYDGKSLVHCVPAEQRAPKIPRPRTQHTGLYVCVSSGVFHMVRRRKTIQR